MMTRRTLQSIAMIVAALAGLIAAAIYVVIFRDDFRGPPLPRNQLLFAPAGRRILEAIIVFWSAVASVGQGFYQIVGAKEDEAITRQQVGGYALFILLFGGVFMMVSFTINILQGQPVLIRDAITVVIGISSIAAALVEWRRSSARHPK